jgi:hypothetical protein
LLIGFETLPGVPVRTVVGNAQAMSSLRRIAPRVKWLIQRELRSPHLAEFRVKIGLDRSPQPDAL